MGAKKTFESSKIRLSQDLKLSYPLTHLGVQTRNCPLVTEVEDGNVDNYIHFLRKRLRELGCKVSIKTVYGAGYRLEETP